MTFHFLSFIRQRETSSLEWGKHSTARVERLRDDYPLSTLRGVGTLAHRIKREGRAKADASTGPFEADSMPCKVPEKSHFAGRYGARPASQRAR